MSGWEIFLGITLGLIVNEACEVSPWAARKLVQWSARVRYADPQRAETRAAELVSLIEERPGKLFKLCTALRFAIAACTFTTARNQQRHLRILFKTTIIAFFIIGAPVNHFRAKQFIVDILDDPNPAHPLIVSIAKIPLTKNGKFHSRSKGA
ncbi:hypothetical protein [Streptosporangium sp. NPDC049376]|uniref:hypothetical protein n=1 Tax=Streptosporangium sp. NPDC049376 TaxID=3366192 RepID=UPI0037B54760